MNVTQHHPMDVIELAPEPFMLPLNDALTEEQHREIQTEQERKVGRGKVAMTLKHHQRECGWKFGCKADAWICCAVGEA
eukprot:1158091-Pelagomonas_calceolata.AAC.1